MFEAHKTNYHASKHCKICRNITSLVQKIYATTARLVALQMMSPSRQSSFTFSVFHRCLFSFTLGGTLFCCVLIAFDVRVFWRNSFPHQNGKKYYTQRLCESLRSHGYRRRLRNSRGSGQEGPEEGLLAVCAGT